MQRITIVGLGYVGLPLACLCAEKGFEVKGLDLNESIVRATNEGLSHIKDRVLEVKVKALKGKIAASTNPSVMKDCETIIVCVPTPAMGSEPDLRPLEKAIETVSGFLGKGTLVIVESTIYPGTIEEVVKPILEKGSNLKAGEDFFLAHCPERIDPGNEKFTIETIPRVLGALSKKGEERALEFYKKIIEAEVVALSSVKAAEAVKVVENSFRDVNIAFVNELAMSFEKMGIDISEVIKGASSKPFGFMPFYPGPGVGGHCIAQDPYYLIARAKKAGFDHTFLKLARSINESMPSYVVGLGEKALKGLGREVSGATIAVLGLAYKKDVDDTRKSPSLEIISLLEKMGAGVKSFDPFVNWENSVSSLEQALENADLVVLATAHTEFVKALTPEFLKGKGIGAVVDARNVLDSKGIKEKGIVYIGIGR